MILSAVIEDISGISNDVAEVNAFVDVIVFLNRC